MASILTELGKTKQVFSDIPGSFELNPVNRDLTKMVNEQSVKQSIKNLLLTNRGERLFQPNIGGDLRALLFENVTPAVISIAEKEVIRMLELYEPRCNVLEAVIDGDIDRNYVRITITFTVINTSEVIEYSVLLDRIR